MTHFPFDYGNDKKFADLLNSEDDAAGNLEEIAKLDLGKPQLQQLEQYVTSPAAAIYLNLAR